MDDQDVAAASTSAANGGGDAQAKPQSEKEMRQTKKKTRRKKPQQQKDNGSSIGDPLLSDTNNNDTPSTSTAATTSATSSSSSILPSSPATSSSTTNVSKKPSTSSGRRGTGAPRDTNRPSGSKPARKKKTKASAGAADIPAANSGFTDEELRMIHEAHGWQTDAEATSIAALADGCDVGDMMAVGELVAPIVQEQLARAPLLTDACRKLVEEGVMGAMNWEFRRRAATIADHALREAADDSDDDEDEEEEEGDEEGEEDAGDNDNADSSQQPKADRPVRSCRAGQKRPYIEDEGSDDEGEDDGNSDDSDFIDSQPPAAKRPRLAPPPPAATTPKKDQQTTTGGKGQTGRRVTPTAVTVASSGQRLLELPISATNKGAVREQRRQKNRQRPLIPVTVTLASDDDEESGAVQSEDEYNEEDYEDAFADSDSGTTAAASGEEEDKENGGNSSSGTDTTTSASTSADGRPGPSSVSADDAAEGGRNAQRATDVGAAGGRLEQERAKMDAFTARAFHRINAALSDDDPNMKLRGLRKYTLVRAGRALALVFMYEESTKRTVNLESQWTDGDLRKFIGDFSAWLADTYCMRSDTNQRKKILKEDKQRLEGVSVVAHCVRVILALRVLKLVDYHHAIKKLVDKEIQEAHAAILNETGASRPLRKSPLLLADADYLCDRMPSVSPKDVMVKALVQVFIATGWRPGSLWKSTGKHGEMRGLRVKDVSFVRICPLLAERKSPHCVVKLMMVHLGNLGYFKKTFDEAVADNDFALDYDKYGDMPVFCQYTRDGNLKPGHIMTGPQAALYNYIADVGHLPRSLVSWRSFRRGHATNICINFMKKNPHWTTEQLVEKLITAGNWRSRVAQKYVDEFVLTYGNDLMAELAFSDRQLTGEQVVDRFPFMTAVQYRYTDHRTLGAVANAQLSVDPDFKRKKMRYEALKRQVEAGNRLHKNAEEKRLATALNKARAAKEDRQKTVLLQSCDVLNVLRFNAAFNDKDQGGRPPKSPNAKFIVDLKEAGKVALKNDAASLALFKYGPFRTPADVPANGVACYVVGCRQRFPNVAAFDAHFNGVHIAGLEQPFKVYCPGCSGFKPKPFHSGDRVQKQNIVLHHFSQNHHQTRRCEDCNLLLAPMVAKVHHERKGCTVSRVLPNTDRLPLRTPPSCDLCQPLRERQQQKIGTICCLSELPLFGRLADAGHLRDMLRFEGVAERDITVPRMRARLQEGARKVLFGAVGVQGDPTREALPKCVLHFLNLSLKADGEQVEQIQSQELI